MWLYPREGRQAMFEEAYYQDDDAAREYLESIRWPTGTICPRCGSRNTATLNVRRQRGLHQCRDCRRQFTVTVGTVFERSHVPLHTWVQATYLLCSSKKGMSSHQIHRMLGVTYKTAWFMTHRIREAMTNGGLFEPLGGAGETVEADETFFGTIPGMEKRRAWHHKMKIMSLVEQGGDVRSFHVPRVNAATLRPVLEAHIAPQTRLITDEADCYTWACNHFASHYTVNHHDREYARDDGITTNTVEGFFSIVKRGLIGTYHHVGMNHLQAYLAEFDFRYNTRKVTDAERSEHALAGIVGKRLFYRH